MKYGTQQLISATIALVTAGAVSAADYPDRPIRFITPAQPGGTTDILARLTGAKLTEVLVADLATGQETLFSGVYPQGGRRVSFTARRVGNGSEETRIVLAGEITGTIWLDNTGHLARIELPGSNLEVIRLRN